MPKRLPTEPQPLTLQTLSGTYEASRGVLHVLPIGTISTFTQMKQRLKKLAQSDDDVIVLFDALTRLELHSTTLGLTTLVQALDHPLVPRITNADKKR